MQGHPRWGDESLHRLGLGQGEARTMAVHQSVLENCNLRTEGGCLLYTCSPVTPSLLSDNCLCGEVKQETTPISGEGMEVQRGEVAPRMAEHV